MKGSFTGWPSDCLRSSLGPDRGHRIVIRSSEPRLCCFSLSSKVNHYKASPGYCYAPFSSLRDTHAMSSAASTTKIAPSVLASDFGKLAAECTRIIKDGADWLHMGERGVGEES